MGVEPTDDTSLCRPTDLKSAGPTGTLAPPDRRSGKRWNAVARRRSRSLVQPVAKEAPGGCQATSLSRASGDSLMGRWMSAAATPSTIPAIHMPS